jgi:hypothetical protein
LYGHVDALPAFLVCVRAPHREHFRRYVETIPFLKKVTNRTSSLPGGTNGLAALLPGGIPFGRSGLPPRMWPLSGLPVHRIPDGRRDAVHCGVGSSLFPSLFPILWSG